MRVLKILFLTSRPISWVNTAYPFALGYLLLGGTLDARFAIGTLFFLIPYNLLMYGLNDVEDYESDLQNPRKGGVEGAITPKKYHPIIVWSALIASVPFVAGMVWLGTVQSWLVLAGVLFFVVAYSLKGLRFKEIPFLDSFTSSMHFVGPLLYAMSLVGVTPEAYLAALAFLLWGMASQGFGAVQDITPDRAAGIHSIATKIGARRTIYFAALLYILAAGLTLTLGIYALGVAIMGAIYAVNVWRFRTISDEDSAKTRKGWGSFLYLNYLTGAVVTISCLLAQVL